MDLFKNDNAANYSSLPSAKTHTSLTIFTVICFMRITSLTLWLTLGLGFSACSGTTPPINNVTLVKWSEASSWASGKVPVAGEAIEIPTGKNILLDVSATNLGDVTINGTLKFAEQDLELSATSIMVHGKLEVGSSDLPFQHQAVITLNGSDEALNPMQMGTKLIGVMGGQLELHGASRGIPWTKLNATAAKGATTITLDGNPGWRVGDKIAIASTDFDPTQAEESVITAVSGNTVTLSKALAYMHYGETQTIAGTNLDERAEVALLSRNIRVQGDDASSTSGFGGHIMDMGSGAMHVENVELFRMGQKQKTGRYPIHWHMMGNNASGSYLKNSSIHNTFNRCVTIHGSNNVTLENNAAFDAIGHCYFLEDGAETGLVLDHNLGFLTKKPKAGEELLPTDTNPSTYWITNPANTIRNNVAAGSQGVGFWIALPERPMGLSSVDKVAANANIYPRRTALTEFSGNVSHSNDNRGLDVDSGPNPNSTPKPMQSETTYYQARVSPVPPGKDANGNNLPDPTLEVTFTNFRAYKNRDRGVWLRGGNLHLKNAVLADNAIGATFASNDTMVENSVMIGESKNVGQKAYSTQPVGLDGRSLPRPWEADFPIRGFEFYDGKVGAMNTTFANFEPNTQRGASGLSYLRFTAFDIDADNFSSNLTFNNANEVFFEDHAVPTTPTSDDGSDGYRAAVFNDSDGKLTGTAGASIVVNNPFILDGCTAKTTWNASICNLEYGRFYFNNLDASAAELSPVSMTREDGAKPVHQMWGVPNSAANENFQTTIINKRNYSLSPNGAMPGHSRIEFRDRKPGDWLLVSIPWTAGTLKIYRDYWIDNRNLLSTATSLSDLNASSGEKYLLENGTLTLKFQIKTARDWAVLDVCQTDLCK
jgi:cell surface hyaluronidase